MPTPEPDYVQEEKDSIAGRRVDEFLADKHVNDSITRRELELSRLIWQAKTPEEVLDLWYVGRSLRSALHALKVTVDKGEYVENTREAREREASRPRRGPRQLAQTE